MAHDLLLQRGLFSCGLSEDQKEIFIADNYVDVMHILNKLIPLCDVIALSNLKCGIITKSALFKN